MKLKILLLFLFFAISVSAQSLFQNFINKVNSISDPSAKNSAVDSFMAASASKGFPYIENNTANFVYRGTVSSAAVAGDFNDWSSNDKMTNLSGTNFYYYTKTFELNARLDYKFVLNSNNWILDPYNPKTVLGGFGPNSELAMPGYVQPWEIKYYSSVKHGTIENHNIYSSIVGANY